MSESSESDSKPSAVVDKKQKLSKNNNDAGVNKKQKVSNKDIVDESHIYPSSIILPQGMDAKAARKKISQWSEGIATATQG